MKIYHVPDEFDWSLTTWDGNRRRQHQEFLALPFRRKLEILEEMAEVAETFARKRQSRAACDRWPEAPGAITRKHGA
jgi:hypothetical protein